MSNKTITPVAAVVGAAIIGSLGAIGVANAADNPFSADQLASGYLQLAGTEGKCGEGKCGGKEGGEGTCGGKEGGEGTCGGKEGGEGKCGEGKCGGAS